MKALGWWHLPEKMEQHVKRQEEELASGLDRADSSTQGLTCMDGLDTGHGVQHGGVLFSHTFYRQVDEGASGPRSYLCAKVSADTGCPCCVGLPNTGSQNSPELLHIQRELPDDQLQPLTPSDSQHMMEALPGCGVGFDGGWNEFWD